MGIIVSHFLFHFLLQEVVDANKDRATMQKTFHNLKSVILSGYDPGGISFCKNEF